MTALLAALAERVNASRRREYWLNLLFWPPVLIGFGFPFVVRNSALAILAVMSLLFALGRWCSRGRWPQFETNVVVAGSVIGGLILVGALTAALGG